jgi:hypothetical protein
MPILLLGASNPLGKRYLAHFASNPLVKRYLAHFASNPLVKLYLAHFAKSKNVRGLTNEEMHLFRDLFETCLLFQPKKVKYERQKWKTTLFFF